MTASYRLLKAVSVGQVAEQVWLEGPFDRAELLQMSFDVAERHRQLRADGCRDRERIAIAGRAVELLERKLQGICS
jgi:hypothetical protein